MSKSAFIDNRIANFGHLIYRVKDPVDQERYVNRWRQQYANAFKNGGPKQLFQWNIRVHKALKETFTSVCFYQESLIAKESNSWAAFFFLNYYSLFHALMSCVVLLPNESITNLSKITHTKLVNVFDSVFCDQSPGIIRPDVGDVFFMLKYMREYYSYNMPPNDFLYEYPDNIKPDMAMPFFIRSCGQLASLHSELIKASSIKHAKPIGDKSYYRSDVEQWYKELNCPRHPKSGDFILHYSDEARMAEAATYPQPVSFLIELEHFIDEFRHYEGAEFPKFADGKEINPGTFVHNMLCR